MIAEPPSSVGERLRHAIDSGQTGDKVKGSDPAAVPLETDAEASGTPTPKSAVTNALDHEVTRTKAQQTGVIEDRRSYNPFAYVYLALVLAFAVAAILSLWRFA